ncbi:MAG: hypothetical protein K0S16_411, partial [Moraxellaceae bacterium]|nr:hypothetical protein [Moraxellaceae bacterium]
MSLISSLLLAVLAFVAGAALMLFVRAAQQGRLAAELEALRTSLQEQTVAVARQQER